MVSFLLAQEQQQLPTQGAQRKIGHREQGTGNREEQSKTRPRIHGTPGQVNANKRELQTKEKQDGTVPSVSAAALECRPPTFGSLASYRLRRRKMANPNKPEQPKGVQSSQGGGQNYRFRCADAGYTDCRWETRGSSREEVMRNAEQHGREKHHMTNMDENTRNKVMSNIKAA